MARSVRWQVPFMSLDNKKYRVDIYQENFNGTVEVLKGAATPFYTQEDDDEDAFLPIRTSSGYLTIVVEDPSLPDAIMAQDTHDRYVELVDATDANNEVVKWNGFLSPEEYSGEWNCTPYEMQLPLLSPIAAAAKIVYEPLSRRCTLAEIIQHIFDDYLEIETSFAFARLTNDNVSEVILTDHIFEREDESAEEPYIGTIPLPVIGSEKVNVYEVLEAICRLYGWVLRETPARYFFTASDVTSSYSCTSDFEHFETVNIPVTNLPNITSADNQRALLSGKSAVQVVCEAEHYDVMADSDLFGNNASPEEEWMGATPPYVSRMRTGKNTNHSIAYDPDTGITEIDSINIWDYNARWGRHYYGGGCYSFATYPDQTESHQLISRNSYEDCFWLGSVESYDDYPAVTLITKKKYSGINFVDNGLVLSFEALCADNWYADFKYCYRERIDVRIKWGNYYFQSYWIYTPEEDRVLWATNPQIVQVMVQNIDSNSSEAVGHAYSCTRKPANWDPNNEVFAWGIGQIIAGTPHGDLGYCMPVPEEIADQLEGHIEITFYCIKERSNCKTMILRNVKLLSPESKDDDILTRKNHYLSDYRQILTQPRLEEYSYKQILTNSMIHRSTSGVVSNGALSYNTPENLLLHRLARWYDRTIEQLTVTTEDDLPDGSVVRIGTTEFLPVSIAHNWRDNEITLMLQKMV